MKTEPLAHQRRALAQSQGRVGYGYFMEQGTGKTWVILADAARAYAKGQIEGLLVLTPNGVEDNWVEDEIPTHMNEPYIAVAYHSSDGKRAFESVERRLFRDRSPGDVPPLRILAMAYSAIRTRRGFQLADRFLNAVPSMLALDESTAIKNPGSTTAKKVRELRRRAYLRRAADGSPATERPLDLYEQLAFIDNDAPGTSNYRSFVARYADLIPTKDAEGKLTSFGKALVDRSPGNPRAGNAQVVRRDALGRPMWKNLERLNHTLSRWSFRVLKSDCLDLPPKVYQRRYFDLTPEQRRIYLRLEDELRLELSDGTLTPVHKLALFTKLQQITSGFTLTPDGEVERYFSDVRDNPRLRALLDVMETAARPVIVWARYVEEIRAAAAALNQAGFKARMIYGAVPRVERNDIRTEFQAGDIDAIVAHPATMAAGFTLHRAQTNIYLSNSFYLRERVQSEDRSHRIGLDHGTVYIDLIARNTRDIVIVRALQQKIDVAALVMGDPRNNAFAYNPTSGTRRTEN